MSRVLWATTGILLLATMVVVIHLASTDQEFSRWNTDWNGTSDFYGILEENGVKEVYSPDSLPDRPGNVLFIVSLREPVPEKDIPQLKAFLDTGNRIVLIDEGRYGEDLAMDLGAGIRFTGSRVTGIDRPWSNPALLLAFPDGNDSLTEGVSTVLLDRPRGIAGGASIVSTGTFSWADENNNGKMDRDEGIGKVPVLVRVSQDKGEVIILSDASAVINGVLRTPAGAGNRLLVRHLAGTGTGVYLDQAHGMTGDSSSLTRAIQVIRNSILIKTASLLVLAGLAAGYLMYRKNRGDHGRDGAER